MHFDVTHVLFVIDMEPTTNRDRIWMYDWLTTIIEEPVVFMLEQRHIIGQFVSTDAGSNLIIPIGNKAIRVLGEGSSWEQAMKKALPLIRVLAWMDRPSKLTKEARSRCVKIALDELTDFAK